MTGTKNIEINYTIFFEYWKSYSKKVKSFDTEAEEKSFHAEVSEIVKSGNVTNFRERIIGEGVVIKSPGEFKSLLHHAVTCEDANRIEMISAVLQSSMDDINHQDENGDTPLMHLLYEAQEKGKYTKKDLEEIIKFLVERGASFKLRNNEGETADDLKTVLISEKILDDKINKIIDEAEKSSNLPNQIKAQLSKYITNNGNPIVKEVTAYGNYVQIELDSDCTEVKISEFLQSDFCKNNGISGFSTFHNDDKGGMHGFLSPNGLRNYTVTDGSYDMTLDWVVGGKKCTITININEDGVVVIDKDGVIVEDRNGLTDEQLKANKYVTINGVSLFDAINNGRNREQKIEQESMQEVDEVDSNASLNSEQIRKNKAPPQLGVQQRESATDAKGNPLKKLRFTQVPDRLRQEETNPKVIGLSGHETSPKGVDWYRGDTGSGVVSAPRLADQLDGQAESGDSVTTRLLSEDEFQARVNPQKASTPKRTEQSDPRNTNPKGIIDWSDGDTDSLILDEGGESTQLNTSTESDSGFSSPTGNAKRKSIGDQSTWQEFERELKGKFAQPNMGLKSPGTSDSQTKQSDSGLGSSPTAHSNQSALDYEQLTRKLNGLRQGAGDEAAQSRLSKEVLSEAISNLKTVEKQPAEKSEVKTPINMMLSQIPKGRIREFLENKKESSAQKTADGNGLGQAASQLAGQKKLPISQQLSVESKAELSSAILRLKHVSEDKMNENAKSYLRDTGDYIKPQHTGAGSRKPTQNHDKTRVGQSNEFNRQEGRHALRVRANSSQGQEGGCKR